MVASVLAEGEETGEVWRELSIGVPTEEYWGEEAWMDRTVHIPEYSRYTAALLALGCSVFRLAGLLQLLELESFT